MLQFFYKPILSKTESCIYICEGHFDMWFYLTSSDDNSEKFQIANSIENSEELALQAISRISESLDCYFDRKGPAAQVANERLWNAIAQLKYKGTKLRLITEITKENIAYCKTMMRYFDVRHQDSLKGSFGILDGTEYLGNILPIDVDSSVRLVRITVDSFIETQKYIFNILWSKSLPAKEKIKEIELGLAKEFIETIKEPQETKKTIFKLLHSATYEILILFSTANSFYRADRFGLLEALRESVDHGVIVRLLVPSEDEEVRKLVEKKLKQRQKQVHIQYLQKQLQSKLVTMIVDQSISLSIEIEHDDREGFEESVGSSTFSNSESTVSSCASIFESLWIQSELDKQNKTKKAYFGVFDDYKLKDENYNRSWQNAKSE